MKNYVPLHCHSQYSLLDGLSTAERIGERMHDLNLQACALTDHGNLCGTIDFLTKVENLCSCGSPKSEHPTKTCESFSSANRKPILGCELYISTESAKLQTPDNAKHQHLPVLAKNFAGWKTLVKITSASNDPKHFYHHPRLSLDELATFADGNIIAFSGHLGSHIANCILDGTDRPTDGWQRRTEAMALWMANTFGRDNFYLEVQRMDGAKTPLQLIVSDCVRTIAKQTGIKTIATPDAHYAYKEDAEDQRIQLCTKLGKTLKECANGPVTGLRCFFESNNFHIPSYDEMVEYGHTEEELDNTNYVASLVEKYNGILKPPVLPNFTCPNGLDADTYLRNLCEAGMQNKIIRKHLDEGLYRDRMNLELGVFSKAGLAPYFLIVSEDILGFCHKNKWLTGPGRGSAAGCLVSYLISITQIDPMPFNLWFERFYNDGRNTATNISLPDIDVDVPIVRREACIQHLKEKYGHDKVAQMVTFQTQKGRAALKNVMRAHGDISFNLMNEMTEYLPEPAKISGDLEAMKEETGDSSIIQWALENSPDKFSAWVTLQDNGELTGPYAQRFEQAMRMEGIKSSMSKHPCGVVITRDALNETCPMVYDTSNKQMIAGLEMNYLDMVGVPKFDILGIAALDKIQGIAEILSTGDIVHV